MTRCNRRRWLRPARALLLALVCASSAPAWADDWETALEQALRLDESGYTFLAIQQIEALRDDYPEVLRLKLELAALYLKVDQPDRADAYLKDVLADPDLPVKVRINAQMLQLDSQTARNEARQQWRTTLALSGGYEAENGDTYTQLSGATRLTRPMPTLDIGGRPVPAQAFADLAGIARQEFSPRDRAWLINLETGLAAGSDRFRLSGGVGGQWSNDLTGPLLFLDSRWIPGPWSVELSNHWLYHGTDWNETHRLTLRRDLATDWRVRAWYRYRWLTDDEPEVEQQLGVGQTLGRDTWRWQLDLTLDPDLDRWGLVTGLDRILTPNWRLGLDLGSDELSRTDNNWYSEVSVRWSR